VTVLQNPVIPIVVRWSMSEASLRIENRRTGESIRPDRLDHVEGACAKLGERLRPILERLVNSAMNDATAKVLTSRVQWAANEVTRETDVLFAVSMETDEDRDRMARERASARGAKP